MKWYKLNRNYLIKIKRYFNLIGICLIKVFYLKNLFKFISQYLLFKKLGRKVKNFYPILDDFGDKTGPVKIQFFHSYLPTNQKVYKNKPLKHLDIESRIDGVVAQIASYRKLNFLDIRDLEINPHI